MSIPTFTTNTNPNVGLGYGVTPRIKQMAMGDGYTQRTGDGLNTMNRPYNLVWGPISQAEADTICAFFEARAGVEPFFWQTPREVQMNLPPRKYVCSQWGRTEPNSITSQVNATFTQDFSLGT